VSRSDLARIFSAFGDEIRGTSDLYAQICEGVAADDEVLAVVEAAPGQAHFPLVVLGAVHHLLLGGVDHPLGAVYRGESDAAVVPLFRDFVLGHRREILEVMAARRTQTNEVGRVSALLPALEWVRRRTGRPLALVDVGSSAGLNLNVDRYRVDYGDRTAGPDDGRPVIRCALRGAPPLPAGRLDVAWRIGLDREPVDIRDPDDARWLTACVWPDQRDRFDRLRNAIAVAREHPVEVVAGDAVSDLPALLARIPTDLQVCVTTTFVVAYFPPDLRGAFVDVLASAGRPVAWVVADVPGGMPEIPLPAAPPRETVTAALVADLYGDGPPERHLLAWMHPHGEWLDWRSEPLGQPGRGAAAASVSDTT
jgi:hypothetical protein